MSNPIAGVACSGRYCDNIRLECRQYLDNNALIVTSHWTGWFSDENVRSAYCPNDMVVNGVQCSGRYCDNMRLQCGRMAAGYRVSTSKRMETVFFFEE